MASSNITNQFNQKTALVTGANSGLGFEAAAQLAEAGYGRVILACRTQAKANVAQQALIERVGRNPFETLAVELSDMTSSQVASQELIKRGTQIDALLLNAGMLSGDEMTKSTDGIELSFASSLIGHHIMTLNLLNGGILADGARLVIAGSEAARDDLPAMMGFKFYDFVKGTPAEFGNTLHDAMTAFAKGSKPELFNSTQYYAVTKVFSSWWAAAMARKFGDRLSVFAVSPGSNLSTNAARHAKGIQKFIFTKIMPLLGASLGLDQPIASGAKRYVDVLNGSENEFTNGGSYMSRPKRMVGPLEEMKQDHFFDIERQEAAWHVLNKLTRTAINNHQIPLDASVG